MTRRHSSNIRIASPLYSDRGRHFTMQVLEISLTRSGTTLTSRIDVAVYGTELDDEGHYLPKARAVVTLVFSEITNLVLEGFNHQNVIAALIIEPAPSTQCVRVSFEPLYGLACDFECERARVESVEELMPTNDRL